MNIDFVQIAFWVFAAVTTGGALLLAATKNVIYGAFLLLVVLLGMAALYVFLDAEFLAVSQVIVYVGGILVILLFGVMLTNKMREVKPKTEIVNLIPGLLVAGSLMAGFYWLTQKVNFISPTHKTTEMAMAGSDVERIGVSTLTDWLLPFELISVLLLAVLVGAAYLTRRPQGGKEGEA